MSAYFDLVWFKTLVAMLALLCDSSVLQYDHHHLACLCLVAVKTNPPSDVKVISEKSFPTSLLINWTQPIAKEHMKLTYEIRFCPNGSQSWTYVSMSESHSHYNLILH